MASQVQRPGAADLARIEAKLDALVESVAAMAARQRAVAELYDEMTPIATLAMGAGAERLSELEKRGYFDFGRELLHVIDRLVTGYSPDDIHAFGDNITRILDMVRSATRPEVLDHMEHAGDAMERAGERVPLTVLGLLRKVRKDDDLRRGLAVVFEGLRQLGKAMHDAPEAEGPSRLNPLLGARRNLARRRSLGPAADARDSPSPEGPAVDPQPPQPAVATVGDPSGGDVESVELAEFGEWSDGAAVAIAGGLGIEMGPRHWQVVHFARDEYRVTGHSPNIRRLTIGAGVPTKELYQLFPRAPAKTVARIAGLPKPVGCI